MMILIIFLAALSVLFFVLSLKQNAKADTMHGTEDVSLADLKRDAEDISREIGAGAFCKQVAVSGKSECSQALTSEFSRKKCVWYKSVLTREYEETVVQTDSEGKSTSGVRRGSETVASNERRVQFTLSDGVGSIEIHPDGADIQGEKVLSSFESNENMSYGSFMRNFVSSPQRRTLGFKYEEWIVPVDASLCIVGEVSDAKGLRIAKSGKKDIPFVISSASKEDLVKAAQKSSRTLKVLAIISGLGAMASAVYMFVKK